MANSNIEKMKKFLEEKKQRHTDEQKTRPTEQVGKNQQAFNSKKKGGSLNK